MSTAEQNQGVIAPLAIQVSEGLRRVSAYSVLFNQAVADRLGINPTDLRCLDFIFREGPLAAGRLAELTGLTTGAITGIVDRLEHASLAERGPDPNDRRRVILTARPEASEKVRPLFASLGIAMFEYCSQFNAGELETIVAFVNGLEPIMREETARVRDPSQDLPPGVDHP